MRESIKEVVITLLIAIGLVVLVIFLFLQDWRTTLIPALTIPVSLLGTFFLMKVLGFSINTLTLFGLTLATGLVVDDAIVVIENIARFIQEKGMPPLEGAREAMREITGAVLASSLVLLAVFVPVAFFPGTTGLLYKQFALTIACSITISLFCALTLTPVLSSLLLGRTGHKQRGIFRPVNRAIDATRSGYHRALPFVMRWRWLVLGVFAVLLAVTGFVYTSTPTAFVPDEDQGFALVTAQLPEGTRDRRHAPRAARHREGADAAAGDHRRVRRRGLQLHRLGLEQDHHVHPAQAVGRAARRGSRAQGASSAASTTRCSAASSRSTPTCSPLRSSRRRCPGSASRPGSPTSWKTARTKDCPRWSRRRRC